MYVLIYLLFAVPDDTPPSLLCPANQTELLNLGETSKNITLPPPAQAVDDSGGNVAITYDPPSTALFTHGTTAVTITATDESGNSDTCVFYVILFSKYISWTHKHKHIKKRKSALV